MSGRYSKVSRRVWHDARFATLSAPQPNAQSLWFRLLTGPELTNIPGLFSAGELALAEALAWPLEGFRKAFAEISAKGMAMADWKARLVWVPRAIQHNAPESPNVVRGWRPTFYDLPECSLKVKALRELMGFVQGMGKGFAKAFVEAFGEPSPNQEQEQEEQTPSPSGVPSPSGPSLQWPSFVALSPSDPEIDAVLEPPARVHASAHVAEHVPESSDTARIPALVLAPVPLPASDAGPKVSRARRGTRCPPSDVAPAALEAWLASWKVPPSPLIPAWLDYHRAKGTTAQDWAASFRTWVRNDARFKGSGGARPPAGTRLENGTKMTARGRPGQGGGHSDDVQSFIDDSEAERMARERKRANV